ncbi:MAG: hypothetical protein QW292_09135 [Candidatus Parvarchaeota archaeon]
MIGENVTSRSAANKRYLYLFFVFLAFLVSIAFRTSYLGSDPPGLYNDELYLMLSAFAQYFHISGLTVPSFNVPDLIFYSLNGYILSILIFHTTPFAARFPVALYGSLIVFPIYLVSYTLLNNRNMAIISSFIWAISPSAIVTSRAGYGVEIFPLFIFLFFVYFWLNFLRTKRRIQLLGAIISIILIFAFGSIRVWAGIPAFGFIVVTLFVLALKKAMKDKKMFQSLYLQYALSLIVGLSSVWAAILYLPKVLGILGYAGALAEVPTSFLLVSKHFPLSLYLFFLRFGYAVSPWKFFWLSEFTHTGLDYGSPVFVPFLLPVFLPFFYLSLFAVPYFFRHSINIKEAYALILILIFFGIVQPLLNITNPANYFEPSEGIFALPFVAMLISFSFYYLVNLTFTTKKTSQYKSKESGREKVYHYFRTERRKLFLVLAFSIVIIFGGLNVASFSSDLYGSSVSYYENNASSLYYMFYGWDQVTNILVAGNFYKLPIFYTPGTAGDLNNSNDFNYWFFHQNFPLYWLYIYSDGKINKIFPVYYNNIVPVVSRDEIILSQNPDYMKILSENGINGKLIWSVYRADGSPAIEIIYIKSNLPQSELDLIRNDNIAYIPTINSFREISVSGLSQLSTQFTVSVEVNLQNVSLEPDHFYYILGTETPAFAISVWPENNYYPEASPKAFVFAADVYSNYSGNYSSTPGSWCRIFGSSVSYNTTYLVTLTYDRGLVSLYVNDTLQGSYNLLYPLYPPGNVIYSDSNLNATLYQTGIWNLSMNPGEIGYMYVNGMNSLLKT